MLDTKMNDILTVLAVGVFADKKIHSSEVLVFIRSVSTVQVSTLDLSLMSEAKALSWFELNKRLIKEKFEGPRDAFEAWFTPIVTRVGEHADKDAFLALLDKIFLADDEVHVSEAAMMVLVKRVWQCEEVFSVAS